MRRILLAAALPLALAACGKTNGEVIKDYTPRMEAVRTELKGLVATLPASGTVVSGKSGDVAPRPVYDAANGSFNTAILPVEALNDEKPAFDLLLSSELESALAWTGPRNPMAESALGATAEGFDKEFEAAIATPIVVLYRTVAYDPPRAVDEKTFEGGTAKIEAFVFTRADGKQVAACSIEAASSQSVSYSYKQGDDPRARLETFARSTLWEDAQNILSQCLGETTGGLFTFRHG